MDETQNNIEQIKQKDEGKNEIIIRDDKKI
jgi:hypothetical protein